MPHQPTLRVIVSGSSLYLFRLATAVVQSVAIDDPGRESGGYRSEYV